MTERPVITDLATLLTEHGGTPYREFLRVPALSLGLFAPDAGYDDVQDPHGQDEVYVVLTGEAVLDVSGDRHPVRAGTIAYVPRGTLHHFCDVSDDVRVVVVFAPPPT